MGNTPSRRAAREQQRKKTSRKYVAAGGAAIILLAGGGLAYNLLNNGQEDNQSVVSAVPETCTSTQRVTVATNTTMAGVLNKVPVDPSDCITLSVSSDISDAEIAAQIVSGKNAPNLWIPDSTARAMLSLEDQSKVVSKSESLAKTPGIIVTATDQPTFSNWNDALGDNKQVSMGDPKVNSGAFIALINAAAETSNGVAPIEKLTNSTGLRAQTIGVDSAALNSEELISAVKDGSTKAAIVTESDFASYLAKNGSSELKASVPSSGTGELNYPMYQLASNETNKTISTAADKITKFLSTDEGKKALAEAGLRDAAGTPLESASVGSVSALGTNDLELVANTWRSYALQSAPLNSLVAVDTSGSMGWMIEGTDQTRMQVTLDSLLAGSQLFPARDSMGLWIFSEDIGATANGVQEDYQELVPVRGFEAPVDGKTQREALQEGITSIKPNVEKGTALNNTLYAMFKNIKGNYKSDAANVVILITDGENNTVSDTLSTEEVIAKIQKEQDPENPVYFVLVGVSEDANMEVLKKIATSVGGEAYSANSPSDIQMIFQEGLTSIATQTADAAAAEESAAPASNQ